MITITLFVCNMNQKMQITQENLEYDLMANSVKFMQQTSLSLSESDTSFFATNTYCTPLT